MPLPLPTGVLSSIVTIDCPLLVDAHRDLGPHAAIGRPRTDLRGRDQARTEW
ncbi:hypothetical protein BTZ20_3885 [Rhodococcus sp. MTM3W5.2]|nr:hypothetical protein BTZ20_3885 [Rhodococcus sp. MTM3W5.2]